MNLYVSNLSFHTTDSDLEKLFSDYGAVVSAKVIMDKESGRTRGFGFVEMSETPAAQEAMSELQGKEIEGRPMSISVAKPKKEGGDQGRGGNAARGNSSRSRMSGKW